MQFFALPQRAICEIHNNPIVRDKTWALISISHNNEWPTVPTQAHDSVNFKGLLRLKFADISSPDDNYVLFNNDHAQQILDFYQDHKKIDVMVAHCLAGQSRSPAVAAALSLIDGGTDDHFFKTATPNMLIYRTILKLYENKNS